MPPLNVFIKILPFILVTNIASASIPLAPRMSAGGQMDMFGCMHSNDYYIANFAAYQVNPAQAKQAKTMQYPMCQEIEKAGLTQITVDMLDRDVRHKLVSIKIFDGDKQLLSETPAKVAKQGYISTQVDFPKPGYYDLAVFVEDPDLHIAPAISALHIPLTVALVVPAPTPSSANVLVIILGIAAFALGLGFLVPRLLKPHATA